MAARGRPFLREGQGKVQKQRRLQRSGQHLAPVDGPVEGIEFAGVIERIQDKRGQAKHVKVSRARSRPPPEQDIQADRKVHQRNQPQSLVLAAVGFRQEDRGVDGDARSNQEVVHSSPDTRGKPLPGEERDARSGNLIGRHQQIAGLDAGPFAGPILQHPLRLETAGSFDPGNRVRGQGKGAFFGKIQGRKNRGRQGEPSEKNYGHPNLKRLKHRVGAKEEQRLLESTRARCGPTGNRPARRLRREAAPICSHSIPLIR